MIDTGSLDSVEGTDVSSIDMEWAKPQYSRREVNAAGRYLVEGLYSPDAEQWNASAEIVDNFRATHAFPLNTIQMRLRAWGDDVDARNIVAQRLKRLTSIIAKLSRFKTMELWDMQDIGGCRAIVRNVQCVDQLVQECKSSHIRHKIVHEDDYIRQPRSSGYRSRHLVFRYYSDRNEVFNELKIEMQIRTPLQHAWATAVETVDAFTGQALKSSSGRKDWERFFQLMATEMAFREGTSLVPNTPENRTELLDELKSHANLLNVSGRLRGFASALKRTSSTVAKLDDYYLLSLDTNSERLTIRSYSPKKLELATEDYAKAEAIVREKTGLDAVLVSVESINSLQKAYPNYFADTREFIKELNKALSGK